MQTYMSPQYFYGWLQERNQRRVGIKREECNVTEGGGRGEEGEKGEEDKIKGKGREKIDGESIDERNGRDKQVRTARGTEAGRAAGLVTSVSKSDLAELGCFNEIASSGEGPPARN